MKAEFVSPIIALVIAVGGNLLQWYFQTRQLRHAASLQKRQLRLTMFDKHFSVYLTVRDFLNRATSSADVPSCKKFLQDTKEAEWLFPQDIVDFINDIYATANDLYSGRNEDTARVWLDGKGHTLAREKFAPFLTLYDEPKT